MIKLDQKIIDKAALLEDVDSEFIKAGVEAGTIVIPKNNNRDFERICGIGKGLSTKVNANIGLSTEASDFDEELRKMEIAVESGADALMDLSTGPDLVEVRKRILDACPVSVGTVPVYELARQGEKFYSMTEDDFVDIIQKQAEEGVDFFTIHAGITLEAAKVVDTDPRIMNIASRGGALLYAWMTRNKKENPFYSGYDRIIKICKEHNVTISLGDSLRPGTILDATDRLQIMELLTLGDLQKKTFESGVQVMIEGPGHVPLDQIAANMELQKRICNGAPFYVLGPLVTDIAPGYDHIVSAIGGAVASSTGADFLCYVTPAEHLGLPDCEDVKNGVIATKIAAHAGDIVKGIPSAIKRNRDMSEARQRRDWKTMFKLAIDPVLPEQIWKRSRTEEDDVCSMCSELCSMKITEESIKAGSRTK